MIGRPAALAALPEGYGPLFDRAAAAFGGDSVLPARAAAFAVFFREAQPIAARLGIPWPSRLEHAVREYLREQGAPLPDPAA